MKTLKFVHCADIHLDAPFREQGSERYSEIRREDIKKAFVKIIEAVKSNQADLLLISGDLYEHQYITRRTMDWLYMVLSEAKVPVILIPGNHDPYLRNSWYRAWDWPANVHILSYEDPHLVLDQYGVNLYGIGFSSFKEGRPDLTRVPQPMKDHFNILMMHGTLDMDFTQHDYMPVSTDELKALNYDYYALGHFHSIKQEHNIINPGSPEPLGFDEPGTHGAFLVTLSDNDGKTLVESSFFETANRTYHDKVLDITGCRTLEEVKIRLLEITDGLDSGRDLVRVTLKGRTELSFDTKALSQMFSNRLYFKIRDNTLMNFDLEALEKDPSLKGAFVREIRKRLADLEKELDKDPDNEEIKTGIEKLNLALSFGLEALRSGKIEWWGE